MMTNRNKLDATINIRNYSH